MTMTGKVFVVEVMLCGQPLSGSVLIDKDDGPIVETARSMVEKYFQYYLSAGPSWAYIPPPSKIFPRLVAGIPVRKEKEKTFATNPDRTGDL